MKYSHWTESSKKVLGYLAKKFGGVPQKQDDGPDFVVGNVRVEVKAAKEYCVTRHANGTRRAGRFYIRPHADVPDFYLFVLVVGLRIHLQVVPGKSVHEEFMNGARCPVSVNWKRIFRKEGIR